MSTETLCDRLTRLASVTKEDIDKGTINPRFLEALSAYEQISRGKQTHYGDYVKNLAGEPPLLQTIQLYCEVKRKFHRFDNMVKRMATGDASVRCDELLEVMADLGVYTIKGIELLLAQEDTGNVG